MGWVTGTASKRRFESFAADAADTLFRTGCMMTGDASEAEDLVQEAFILVARRWHRVAAMDHPVAYARRVVINLALDGAKRRSRHRAELDPEGGALEVTDDSAARALQQVDDLAEFRWALERLAPRERAVLVLRYWADLPVAEVAATLGCSAGTVKSTASRGAARLAQILAHNQPPASQPAARHAVGTRRHDHR